MRRLFAVTCLVALCEASAPAEPYVRTTLELGVHGAHWEVQGESADGAGLDVRLTAQRSLGLQLGYTRVPLAASAIPEPGYAVQPDLRAELVIAPFPNRFLSPNATVGIGIATYAEDRGALLVGFGGDVALGDNLSLSATYRVAAPTPFAAEKAARARVEAQVREDLAAGREPARPDVSAFIDEYYNSRTYELTLGLRLVY